MLLRFGHSERESLTRPPTLRPLTRWSNRKLMTANDVVDGARFRRRIAV